MSDATWVDYYETLQLSSGADADTVERVYRLLAKRYHPDNPHSGDVDRFNQVRQAFEVLSDPARRAAYDATYDHDRSQVWQLFRQDSAEADRDDDQRLFHGILSLLYIARRRDPIGGGMAPMTLERLLGVDREHLTFPLWYLKQRRYIEILESGLTAITVDGIDKLGTKELSLPAHRLLTERTVGDTDPGPHELPRYSSAG
jgi:curved DNA-binding protein CbpA